NVRLADCPFRRPAFLSPEAGRLRNRNAPNQHDAWRDLLSHGRRRLLFCPEVFRPSCSRAAISSCTAGDALGILKSLRAAPIAAGDPRGGKVLPGIAEQQNPELLRRFDGKL